MFHELYANDNFGGVPISSPELPESTIGRYPEHARVLIVKRLALSWHTHPLPQTAHVSANPWRGMGRVMGLDGGADWGAGMRIL